MIKTQKSYNQIKFTEETNTLIKIEQFGAIYHIFLVKLYVSSSDMILYWPMTCQNLNQNLESQGYDNYKQCTVQFQCDYNPGKIKYFQDI